MKTATSITPLSLTEVSAQTNAQQTTKNHPLLSKGSAILFILLLALVSVLPITVLAAELSVAPDLAFTKVVTVGQNGFTEATGPRGIDRRMVFDGTRNGVRTLYLYDDGVFIEVLPANGTLPNGMGTADSFLAQYRMLPNGDILFKANVTGGSLPTGQYNFRWHNGAITVQQPMGSNFNYLTSDGRWLVEVATGTFPTHTFHYSLSDGTSQTPLISLTGADTACHRTESKVHAVNANGVVAYTTYRFEKSVCNSRHLAEWSVRLGGPISQTLLSGSYTSPAGGKLNGVGPNLIGAILNDNNELLMMLDTYDGNGNTLRQNVVLGSGGGVQRVLFDTSDPQVYANLPTYFDAQGRIAVVGRLGSFSGPFALLRGDNDNPAEDVVIQVGDPLFGSTLSLIQPTFSAYQDLAIVGENRGFYFTYDLADGTKGIGLASKNIPHWANPDGGNWNTAANWTPAGVPTDTADVVFDLSHTYAVNIGTRKIGGVIIGKGDVTFRNGSLEVAPLNLAVFDPVGAHGPRLTIGAAGSSTSVTANLNVGPGELVINNAQVIAPDSDIVSGTVELGVLGPATVTVTNGADWRWQQMQIGVAYTAQVRIENGAFVGNVPAEQLIIGGGSGVVNNAVATVMVDGASNNPGPFGLGTTLGASILNLVVGQELIGNLEVTNGGGVFAINSTVGTMDHGNRIDGSVLLSGGNATRPSTFDAGNDVANNGGLFAATGAGTSAQIEVVAGGLMRVTSLSLAGGTQSNALMFVDGADGQRRSSLLAPLPPSGIPQAPNPSAGICVIGQVGQGTLNVSNGGLAECRNIAVGYMPGSVGELNIGGPFGGFTSQVIARGTVDGDGLVCIGSMTACGQPATGARGDVTLAGGLLEGEMVLVGTHGRIRGNGTVIALQGVHLVGGTIAPGLTVLTPNQARTGLNSASSLANHTGILTIQGNLNISGTGIVALDLLGAAADKQDVVVVTGTVNMQGRLALNFANGYAPQTGDQLLLIQAGTFSGTPSDIIITGLADGFEYDLVMVGQTLALVALNDGVPTTQPLAYSTYLPSVTRSSSYQSP